MIPGDGVGKEVVPEGLKAIQAAAVATGFVVRSDFFPWGSEFYLRIGEMMPSDGIDTLVFEAIVKVLREGHVRTPDIRGSSTTAEVGAATAKSIATLAGIHE